MKGVCWQGAVLPLVLWPALLAAQPAPRPGSLRVTVRDATELPVAGATVTASQPDGTKGAATTDAGGQANITGLRPGSYTVNVDAPGLRRQRRRHPQRAAGGRRPQTPGAVRGRRTWI